MSRRTSCRLVAMAQDIADPRVARRRPAGGRPGVIRPGRDAWRIAARLLVLASLTATLATFLGHAVRGSVSDPNTLLAVTLNAGVAIAHLAIGLLLIERGRGGAIGPLLLAAGVVAAVIGPLDLYLTAVYSDVPPESLPAGGLAALVFLASGYPISAAVVAAMLVFPDGRLLSRRWRWALVLGVVGTLGGIVAFTFGDADFGPVYPMFASPFRVRGFPRPEIEIVSSLALQAFRILAVVSLILRWRRGDRVVRAQTTWVLAVLALGAIAQAAGFAVREEWDWTSYWVSLGVAATVMCVPLAMGVAIVRFHLFEIDRLVSRTIAYAAITAVLGTIYVACSLGLAGVIGAGRQGEAISVALATLVVATLFSTLRSRVQRIVDRRFDRARYDGTRAVDGLAERLRGDVELEHVRDDVLTVVDQTMHPAMRSIWLRSGRGTELG
jgi:hypothetical protein